MKNIFKSIFLLISIFTIRVTYAQNWGGAGGSGKGGWSAAQMNIGRLYGKVVDANSGKKIEFATVKLFQNRWDSVSKSMKVVLAGGALSEANGDFSIEKLPLFGKYKVKIAAIGYQEIEIETGFEVSMNMQNNPMEAAKKIEKDLGNIKLILDVKQLSGVEVKSETPDFRLEIDKKIYNVEKNHVNAGGTAEDVMKNIPSVNVDIDGNVTVRNSAPQIFVDGRPSTLTLDQIPADAIENVELITNPSAKYDASGGMGGIINIVLKKSKRIGYSGMLRGGVDMRGKINAGADFNVRENKLNFFINLNYNQRKSIGYGETERNNFFSIPTNVFQTSNNSSTGYFGLVRAGVDYFIDNRSTLTLSGSYHEGAFDMTDDLKTVTDTLYSGSSASSYYTRLSNSDRKFNNYGTSLLYKYIYPKAGKELTADVNYNASSNDGTGLFNTKYYNSANTLYATTDQKQQGGGTSGFTTAQTDFVNPLSEKSKIEMGLRAAIRNYTSETDNFILNSFSGEYMLLPSLTNNYKFTDKVYAAYSTYTNKIDKFGYQAGLRLESSDYKGNLIDSSLSFRNQYPLSLFPSLFTTYTLSEKNEFQLSYTRRINRPNFFQLIPFTDYSDSLNLRKGNPDLKPEFTNSLELNHQYTKDRSNTFISTAYFKMATGTTTNFQVVEYDSILNRNAVISTYENANKSYSYGMEFTAKNKIKSWFDFTANLNLYNTVIDGTNLQTSLKNELFSWFAKLNLNFKLPKDISYQVTGEYQAKSIAAAESRRNSGSGMFGGMGWGMGSTSTAQGYNRPRYEVGMSLRYEFLKNKTASVSLSVSDIFKQKKQDSFSKSDYFIQNSLRYRDQQFVRLNFSYRFGKFDTSLFRRKNNKIGIDTDSMQSM